MKIWTAFACALLVGGCTSTEEASDEEATDEPTPAPPDDFSQPAPAVDDGWVPRLPAATRFGVFYQVSQDVLDHYQGATGLPQVSDHAWIITQSHATAFAG